LAAVPGGDSGVSEWRWLSSRALTAVVRVEDGRVVESWSPITRRFVGQPYGNLLRWMNRQGGLINKPINIDTEDS
jgi:hypothetical protein